jgi:hypothetical protein
MFAREHSEAGDAGNEIADISALSAAEGILKFAGT